jgi:hypothetical protein
MCKVASSENVIEKLEPDCQGKAEAAKPKIAACPTQAAASP